MHEQYLHAALNMSPQTGANQPTFTTSAHYDTLYYYHRPNGSPVLC